MSPRKTRLYFWEWGRVRDVLKGRGMDGALIESRRHQLHKQALGADKSSKDFTNADLDKVLAAFRAITEPGNLRAQLRALEQPAERKADVWLQIDALLEELAVGTHEALDEYDLHERRMRYVGGILERVIGRGRTWDSLTDAEAAKLYWTLRNRVLAQRQKAIGTAPAAATPPPADIPF